MFVFLCRSFCGWLYKNSTFHVLVPSSLCSLVAPMLHLAKLPAVLGSWLFYTKLLMLHINQCDSMMLIQEHESQLWQWTGGFAVKHTYFWCRNINVAEARTSGLLLFSQNYIWSTRPVVSLNSLPPVFPHGEVTRACKSSASMTGLNWFFLY